MHHLAGEQFGDAIGSERRKTYRCNVESGEASPGYEPEPDAAAVYSIIDIAWFDVRTPEAWPEELLTEQITFPLLQCLRVLLGYAADVAPAPTSEA